MFPLYVAALWWGALTSLGFAVVPTLFARMATPAAAGAVAARLFTTQAWLSIACGVALLVFYRTNRAVAQVKWTSDAIIMIATGVFCAILIEFAIAPRIQSRQDLALWHGLATTLFALQWLCAASTLWIAGHASVWRPDGPATR